MDLVQKDGTSASNEASAQRAPSDFHGPCSQLKVDAILARLRARASSTGK